MVVSQQTVVITPIGIEALFDLATNSCDMVQETEVRVVRKVLQGCS